MADVRRLLIAIADGAHVRFVRPAATRTPHATAAIGPLSAPGRLPETGAGSPAAPFHGHAAAYHAVASGHDPHLLEKQMVAKVVAGQLNAAAERRDFDGLILVAPPRTLKTICDALNAATRARLVAALENGLVQMLDRDLLPYIQAWVDQADRQAMDTNGHISTQGGNVSDHVVQPILSA